MPSPNQRVSEYVLDERIGAGTFGEVWRARHHVWTDQFVAIKIPTDPQYLRNLQREGAAVHGLVHPNIVRAIGFDPYAPTPYLTMEYIPGTSLRPLISKRSLSVDDVVAILKQVLAGLGHAHERGLVHRDVKPENILIHERAARDGYAAEGVVKVTDFGLGSATTATAVGSIVYSASLERGGGEIAGSLDYMAPEQRSGADVDARADLYACGVMLYEMLTGERPAGTDVPSDVNPNAPRYLDDLFRRSYARLDKRFKDAAEFAAGLTAPARTIVSSIPSLTPPVPMPSSGATGMNGEKVLCPVCSGRGIKPGAEWTFCDHCRGMGKLRGRSPQGEIEIECPKCRGHGTQAPEKCANCRGSGRVETSAAAGAPVAVASHGSPRVSCPQCRQGVEPTDQFCMHCGVQLVATVRRCPKCGAYPDGSDKYCIFCGQTLAPEGVAV